MLQRDDVLQAKMGEWGQWKKSSGSWLNHMISILPCNVLHQQLRDVSSLMYIMIS
jgi:hypothetical protein